MKRTNLLISVGLIAALALTAACSSDVKVSPSGAPGKKKVAGKLSANFMGEWKTECLPYPVGMGTYFTKALKIEPKKLEYQERFFSDSSCTKESDEAIIRAGTYGVLGTLSDGRNQVELRVPLGQNMNQIFEFNLSLKENELQMSEFYNSAFDKAKDYKGRYTFAKIQKASGGEGEKQAPPTPQVPLLKSGDYKVTSGSMELCDQNIAVGKNRETGLIAEVWVSTLPPCHLVTRPYVCDEKGVCAFEGRVLTIQSETSYQWEDALNGYKAIFEIK